MKSCDAAVRRFSEQYRNAPGVLGVEKDGFLSDSILVFIDKDKYDRKLPGEFDGFDVSLYDVKYMLNAAVRFLNIVYEEKLDLSEPELYNTCEHFAQTIEICERLLCQKEE